VSDFLNRHGGNLVHADQHTDGAAGLFLQRVEWDVEGFDIPLKRLEDEFLPIADRFDMTWELRTRERRLRIAILVSKQGHCLVDLLGRWGLGELAAEIPVVASNHPDLESEARRFGVDWMHVPVTAETKAEQEAAILARLERESVDLVVLARYMQILSPEFLARYPNRIINIHHSFLPAFAGARPYHQAHERGVKVIGATAHYATADLDEGPIIEQDVVRVSHRDSIRDLIAHGRDLEKVVLARAVQLHLSDRILVYGNKTVVFD
jgi:formyltetrahydrofolate deformylase